MARHARSRPMTFPACPSPPASATSVMRSGSPRNGADATMPSARPGIVDCRALPRSRRRRCPPIGSRRSGVRARAPGHRCGRARRGCDRGNGRNARRRRSCRNRRRGRRDRRARAGARPMGSLRARRVHTGRAQRAWDCWSRGDTDSRARQAQHGKPSGLVFPVLPDLLAVRLGQAGGNRSVAQPERSRVDHDPGRTDRTCAARKPSRVRANSHRPAQMDHTGLRYSPNAA